MAEYDIAALPDVALSIQQPWAYLIVHGKKSIENRGWKPWNPGLKFRGPVAIHAGKNFDKGALDDVLAARHPVTGDSSFIGFPPMPDYFDLKAGKFNGGIVGVAEMIDVITESDNEWFVGTYGLVLRGARPVPFIPCKGALGFFKWKDRVL